MGLILLWSFIAYGMTTIIVYGSIFESTRNKIHAHSQRKKHFFLGVSKFLSGLISCMLCSSTWVGFFLSITIGGLSEKILGTHWVMSVFFDGMFTAGVVWSINAIVEFFEESRINTK
jgi:hypothetical protein